MRRGEAAVAGVILEHSELNRILAHVAGQARLWVATGEGEEAAFLPYRPGIPLRRGPGPTRRTAKEIFFPRTEALFTFHEADGKPRLEPAKVDDGPLVVFGLRPCDARALCLLDPVFEDPLWPDRLYGGRRARAILVGMACSQPSRACFCTSVGGDPAGEEGLDVILVALDDAYLARATTDRGAEWLEGLGFSPAPPEAEAAAARVAETARRALAAVPADGLKERLDGRFEHPVWDRLHERCLGCAACTYLCPTCHCFDIVDEGGPGEGVRLRNWDSCMFALFTLHASGHNPRMTGKERMRQRIMHKFNYYPERQGRPACVGCGRCVEICPVNLDLRQVIAELEGVEA